MAKQVPWNKIIVEEFVSLAILSKEEEIILRTRAAGWTRVQQSTELNISLSTVDRHIASLKKKYDEVQKFSPLLPPRRMSECEKYLDEH